MEAVLLRELSKLEPGLSEEVWLKNGSAWWYVKPSDWLSQHRHPEHLPNAPETQDTYGTLIPKSGFSSGLDGKESTCNARDFLAFSISLDNLPFRDKYLLSCVRVNHNSWQTILTNLTVFLFVCLFVFYKPLILYLPQNTFGFYQNLGLPSCNT